jgi:hypothetical protein
VRTIPVVTDKARDKKFSTEGIGFGERQCMMDEQSVADGLVDHSIEDMSKQLALDSR